MQFTILVRQWPKLPLLSACECIKIFVLINTEECNGNRYIRMFYICNALSLINSIYSQFIDMDYEGKRIYRSAFCSTFMSRPVLLGFLINKSPLWDGAGFWPIKVNSFFHSVFRIVHICFSPFMHRFYSVGLEKWYKPMIWLDNNQNYLLLCQNDVIISLVERVNQGESLASWLNWLTEPPAVCWSVIMGDLSASWKGIYWTLRKAFRTGLPSCAVYSMDKTAEQCKLDI